MLCNGVRLVSQRELAGEWLLRTPLVQSRKETESRLGSRMTGAEKVIEFRPASVLSSKTKSLPDAH